MTRLMCKLLVAAFAVSSVFVSATSASAATAFSTTTAWRWAYQTLAATPGTTQSVQAGVSGLTDVDKNGAVVLRRSSTEQFVLVNYTDKLVSLSLISGGQMTKVREAGRPAGTAGTIRAEITGTTVKAFWNGTLSLTATLPALDGYRGTGTGLGIWQDRASAVALSAATVTGAAPVPPTPVPAGARSVTIGSSTLPITGTNIERAADSLVAYTSSTGPLTPTNVWGAEATVINGKITSVNDRQQTGGTATPIPAGGLVLSAHGTARDWLLTYATTGSSITVNTTTTPTPTPTPTPSVPSGSWLSGAAAGPTVTSGAFGDWRGRPVEIAGTWNDSQDAQLNQYSVQPGAELGAWTKDLDVAVGAIYKDAGQTWAAAANGAYDAQWSTALNNLKNARGSRPGTVHIRFAHEFNGDWTPWSVSGAEAPAFITSWRRFRALQQSIYPAAKLVFCPNDGTSGSLNLDWRKTFPGSSYIDEMGVDSYNQYPWVNTPAGFASKINTTDRYGAPEGIEKHRQFAESVGLPLAIAEWGSNADDGDAPVFIKEFYSWVGVHAGNGAGQIAYEIEFNVGNFGTGQFQLFPTNRSPQAADAYRQLW